MSSLPLHFRLVGQDDYMRTIDVGASGHYRVQHGDHASHTPREGVLSPGQLAGLLDLGMRLGAPREHPAPEGASGFMAELHLGSGATGRVYRFWEGALDEEPDLAAMVRGLDGI